MGPIGTCDYTWQTAMVYERKVDIRRVIGYCCCEQGVRTPDVLYVGPAGPQGAVGPAGPNPTWNRTTFNYERSVTRTLFMEENSDGDR